MGLYDQLAALRTDSDALRKCINETVEALLANETDVDHPGMLLGNIQSGKTMAFTGVIALGFDRKYDLAIVFTKGTNALVKQTVQRLKNEFKEFEDGDILQIYDVMEMPEDLGAYTVERQKLILVVKKEDDNIRRLSKIFSSTYPLFQSKKILIVDDEADFVSIGYRTVKRSDGTKELDLNVISRQISDFRKKSAKSSDYLQVTATPYSLYLQPKTIQVKDAIFSPMRPRFTKLLPIHDKYIGSDYYFEESKKEDSPARYLFEAIDENELATVGKTHGKIFNNVLSSPAVQHIRSAIFNYLTGSCVRILQESGEGQRVYKTSFIVHTETSKVKHQNQIDLVKAIIAALNGLGGDSNILAELLRPSFEDIALSVLAGKYPMPSFESVVVKATEMVRYITVRRINSDSDIISLLNIGTGELRLESPLNIFVGGQILDRGITIQNLIGFYYGRNPKRMQQDTVMQHARIFGARSLHDMAVTRLYTTDRIYNAMRRMHEADKALRKLFEEAGPNAKVAFIQKAADGKIIPCNPNKLLISSTVTLRPGGTLAIYGFQTKAKTHISRLISEIGSVLLDKSQNDVARPFLISVELGKYIINKIFATYDEEAGVLGSTKEEFLAAMEYSSSMSSNESLKGQIYCFSNSRPKGNARYKDNQRGKMFNDVPYDGRSDSKVAQTVAIDIPCLFLSYQAGRKEDEWRDAEFYWPVLFVQQNLVTSIFTTESDPGEETDDTGPMYK